MLLQRHQRAISQCWPKRCTVTSHLTILISPLLGKPVEVLTVLLHELIHASVGMRCGHRGAFQTVAIAAWMISPMDSTQAGKELAHRLYDLAESIGEFPHVRLNAQAIEDERKKQKMRLRLYECDSCGQKMRATSDTMHDRRPSNWRRSRTSSPSRATSRASSTRQQLVQCPSAILSASPRRIWPGRWKRNQAAERVCGRVSAMGAIPREGRRMSSSMYLSCAGAKLVDAAQTDRA